MAVKVRCPTCEKVLNAPDAARGKAVKCPECDTKVKVPDDDSSKTGSSTTRRSGSKAPAKKRAAADDDEFLAGLDLDKVIDSSSQMCPKCGANIPEDATECPQCGVDPETGQLSSSAKKRMSRKGADPALFYSLAWSDSWSFMMENKRVAIRTALYIILFAAIQGGCWFLAWWSTNLPPKFFWLTMVGVTGLVIPGWIWCLTVETVRTTVARKTSIRQVHFDIFQNMALGLKQIFWGIIFCWMPGAAFMEPLAMIHMAMPVTTRAWLNFQMLPTFFRNFMPTMYVWVIRFVTYLLPNVMVFLTAFFSFATAIAYVNAIQNKGTMPEKTALIILFSVAGLVGILAIFLYSFMLIFNMRVVGLLAYYFKDTLDLVVLVADKTYVRKEVKLDKWGNPITTPGQIVVKVLIVVVALVVVAGVGYFVYTRLK
jgi:ribosomal protein L40E/phage FluMu protein Com